MDDADRVNFLVRPGLNCSRPWNRGAGYELGDEPDDRQPWSSRSIVTDDFTVSAAHGFAFMSARLGRPRVPSSTSDYGFFGNNWTNFGFHYYLKKK